MARLLILAASAPLLLIGASYPGDKPGAGYDEPDYAAEAPVTYRPCRPGPGDDRCIQLYERGVRVAYARWLRDHGVTDRPTRAAMGGPYEPSARPTRRRYSSEHAARDGQHPEHHGRYEEDHDRHGERCLKDEGIGDEARGM